VTVHRGHGMVALAVLAGLSPAEAAVTVAGSVGDSGKYLVSGTPVSGPATAIVKFTFRTLTPGARLSLCAGTLADFESGRCAIHLASSEGPDAMFLSIVDLRTLGGKMLYVSRGGGAGNARFELTAE
jgi:hypothetical protein